MRQPKKLRTTLTIGHLHQWALGHNCQSQTAATMPAERTKGHSFLPVAKLFTVWGAN
jgi:hypothetical protein